MVPALTANFPPLTSKYVVLRSLSAELVLYSLWFLIAVAVAALVGALIAFSRLTLRLNYNRQGSDDRLFVEVVALWGLLRYGLTIPVLMVDPAIEGAPGVKITIAGEEGLNARGYFAGLAVICRLLQRLGVFCSRYRQAIDYLWRRSRVTSFEWHTILGTGEPATTGAVCGLLWGIKGFVLGRVNPLRQTSGSISLKPDFRSPTFGTVVNLTASLQVRHFLMAGLSFFVALKRSEKKVALHRPRKGKQSHRKGMIN